VIRIWKACQENKNLEDINEGREDSREEDKAQNLN